MVRPERRTRADLIAVAAIVAIIVVVAAAIWWTSDARATISRPATVPTANAIPPKDVPATLTELWKAASPRTTVPVIAGNTIVTGDGRTVTGRDPGTGTERWSYARDRDLCAVSWVYHFAVAVYPDGRGCGQVSTIDSADGRRGPSRSGYADKHVQVTSDGTTVLSVGDTRLELWRSDMVRMIGYGEVDARIKPGQTGLGKGCTLMSAAASSTAVAVIQACPDQADVRLTLLKPADQDDEPELHDVEQKGVTPESGARVLAVSETTTAVYLPLPQPRIGIYDETGGEKASILLPGPPTSAAPQGTVSKPGDLITWWTGDSLVVFDAKLGYKYTIIGNGTTVPLGPGAMMAGKLIVPVTGGIAVYDPANGASAGVIPVNRQSTGETATAIVPAVIGSTILEQRGDTVVALGVPR